MALIISSPFLLEICRKLVSFGELCFQGFFLSFLCVVVAVSSACVINSMHLCEGCLYRTALTYGKKDFNSSCRRFLD